MFGPAPQVSSLLSFFPLFLVGLFILCFCDPLLEENEGVWLFFFPPVRHPSVDGRIQDRPDVRSLSPNPWPFVALGVSMLRAWVQKDSLFRALTSAPSPSSSPSAIPQVIFLFRFVLLLLTFCFS